MDLLAVRHVVDAKHHLSHRSNVGNSNSSKMVVSDKDYSTNGRTVKKVTTVITVIVMPVITAAKRAIANNNSDNGGVTHVKALRAETRNLS